MCSYMEGADSLRDLAFSSRLELLDLALVPWQTALKALKAPKKLQRLR